MEINGDDGDLIGEDKDATRQTKIVTVACRVAHDVEFLSPSRRRIISVDCASDRPPDAQWKVREGGEEWGRVHGLAYRAFSDFFLVFLR